MYSLALCLFTHSPSTFGNYLALTGMLHGVPQAEDEVMQTRALQALQSLAKGKRGGSNLPMQAIQTAFQQGKGLPRLVHLLDRVVTPRSTRAGQGKAIMAGAIDALAAMTRNNAAARHAAQLAWLPLLEILSLDDCCPVELPSNMRRCSDLFACLMAQIAVLQISQ